MSSPIYNWLIVYEDKTVEVTQSENAMDAIDAAEEDWYEKGIISVTRIDYA